MLRLLTEDMDRIDALIPYVEEATRSFAVSKITRSSVIRAAVIRGLDSMEEEYRELGGELEKEEIPPAGGDKKPKG